LELINKRDVERPKVSGIKNSYKHFISMKELDTFNNKAGEKILMKYINQFGNLIVGGSVYLEVVISKVTF